MKNKLIYIIPAIAAIAVIGFAATKIPFQTAATETSVTASSAAETSATVTTETATTSIIQETITAVTEALTNKEPAATVSSTQIVTTEGTTKIFILTMPSIQIPALKNETTAQSTTKPATTEYDASCFDSTAFIGNSRFGSFKNFGLAKNVYSVVGLNVETVFTKSVAGSTVPVIDELNGKSFNKVVLLFGDNECGWPDPNVFAEKYAKVIAAVRERVPEAEIYLHAILPVSTLASETNQFGCNNQKISVLNDKIEELAAKEGAHYIPQPECLKTEDGSLIPEAASDGIHLNKKYAKYWIISLADEIIY